MLKSYYKVWSYGWESSSILIDNSDIESFLKKPANKIKNIVRGNRGAFYKAGIMELQPQKTESWVIVADINKTQAEVAELSNSLQDNKTIIESVNNDIKAGRNALEVLVQASDGLQCCSEEIVSTYHRANVLFNIMRGGVFSDNYVISKRLLLSNITKNNKLITKEYLAPIFDLPETFTLNALSEVSKSTTNLDLKRICNEYLPLVFSRRHGDPSRPWNRFNIQTKDENGNNIVGFQGNWRDIFQNWEALSYSFPLIMMLLFISF